MFAAAGGEWLAFVGIAVPVAMALVTAIVGWVVRVDRKLTRIDVATGALPELEREVERHGRKLTEHHHRILHLEKRHEGPAAS